MGSKVDDLIRLSGDIDVYVISGEAGREPGTPRLRQSITSPARNYLFSALVVALASGGWRYAVAVAPGVLAHTLAFVGVLALQS